MSIRRATWLTGGAGWVTWIGSAWWSQAPAGAQASPIGPFVVGDTYSYRAIDLATKRQTRQWSETVTGVSDSQITFDNGAFIVDPFGNELKSSNPNVISPTQFLPREYVVGEKWTTRFRVRNLRNGSKDEAVVDLEITGKEEITVPAGTFDTFKIAGQGTTIHDQASRIRALWVSLDVRRPIALETVLRSRNGDVLVNERDELVAFRQA